MTQPSKLTLDSESVLRNGVWYEADEVTVAVPLEAPQAVADAMFNTGIPLSCNDVDKLYRATLVSLPVNSRDFDAGLEAAAKVCEDFSATGPDASGWTAKDYGQAIRALKRGFDEST